MALSRLARQEFASQAEGDCGGQAAEVIAEIVVPSLMEVSKEVSKGKADFAYSLDRDLFATSVFQSWERPAFAP